MDNFNLSKYLKNNPLLKSKNKVNESIGGYRDIPALREMEENDPTYYDDNYGMEKPEKEVTNYFTLTDDELQTARKLASKYPNIYVGKTAKAPAKGLNVVVSGPKNEVDNFEKDMEDFYDKQPTKSTEEDDLDY
jgi:hypothetical protein